MADSRTEHLADDKDKQPSSLEGHASNNGISQNFHVVMPRKVSEAGSARHETRKSMTCPRVNCPEKIIIVLDISTEMHKVSFRSRAGDKFSPWKLAKRAIGMFVHNKHVIDPRHQFALVLLDDQARWMLDFTHNPNDIVNYLEDFAETKTVDTCDLSSLFDVVNDVALPNVANVSVMPPPYIVRTILIYGRSNCLPILTNQDELKLLQGSPHFFLDVYYIHEPPSEQNECEAIFDTLCQLDVHGLYYVFEVSRNPTKVYDCMSQLLAHPLQRPLQEDTFYSIEPPTAAAEICG